MEINEILRPHQQQSVETLLQIFQHHTSAVDASDMGTGKTFVACAIAHRLQVPTLVIAPKIALTNWRQTIQHFNDSLSIINYEQLCTGRTNFGTWENQGSLQSGRRKFEFVCQFCLRRFTDGQTVEMCPFQAKGCHCFDTRRIPVRRGQFNFHPAIKFAIFDEAHRTGGTDSLNAEILLACKRQGIPHLLMSATLADSPLKMRAIGFSLDLHNDKTDVVYPVNKPNFFRWCSRRGVRRDPRFHGLKWFAGEKEKQSIMAEINEAIFPARGVRVSTADIPGFPEQQILAELYDIEESSQIEKIYAEMRDALGVLDEKKSTDSDSKAVEILRARQRIGLLKVPLATELATDSLDAGRSVVLFCNFHQEIDELANRLSCPSIDGRTKDRDREKIIASFQRNDTRCLAVQSDAVGITISLQDRDGQHPRIGYVFPPWSATTFTQLTGRFRREGGKSASVFKVMLAAGTIEEKVHRVLRSKIMCGQSLNDGDFQPDFLMLRSRETLK